MRLKRLGKLRKPRVGTKHNLKEYFIDSEGNVYTMNKGTYVTKYGRFVISSNGRDLTVTMRDTKGRKVSIRKSTLKRIYWGIYNDYQRLRA